MSAQIRSLPVAVLFTLTADGTAGGVGKSVTRVLGALQHIAKQLQNKQSTVNGAAEWAKDEHIAEGSKGPA